MIEVVGNLGRRVWCKGLIKDKCTINNVCFVLVLIILVSLWSLISSVFFVLSSWDQYQLVIVRVRLRTYLAKFVTIRTQILISFFSVFLYFRFLMRSLKGSCFPR